MIDETQLRIFHFEGSAWVDGTSSLDTNAHVICASVSSLSPFVVAERRLNLTALAPANIWLGLKNSDGSALSVRLSVRIAATGRRSGTARLWFNDAGSSEGVNDRRVARADQKDSLASDVVDGVFRTAEPILPRLDCIR